MDDSNERVTVGVDDRLISVGDAVVDGLETSQKSTQYLWESPSWRFAGRCRGLRRIGSAESDADIVALTNVFRE